MDDMEFDGALEKLTQRITEIKAKEESRDNISIEKLHNDLTDKITGNLNDLETSIAETNLSVQKSSDEGLKAIAEKLTVLEENVSTLSRDIRTSLNDFKTKADNITLQTDSLKEGVKTIIQYLLATSK